MPATTKTQLNPFLKLALEMGPLLLFFFANSRPALFMPLVGPLLPEAASGEKAGIFVATAVFMAAILVSLAVSYTLTRHLPVMAMVTAAIVFDSVFDLTQEGWRKLTLRWAIFFLALAVLNEIVWRTQTTDFWVSFKVFGVVPLTFVFAALQYPLLQKYAPK